MTQYTVAGRGFDLGVDFVNGELGCKKLIERVDRLNKVIFNIFWPYFNYNKTYNASRAKRAKK